MPNLTNDESIAASVSGAQAEGGMSGREPGWYWVRIHGAVWSPALYDGIAPKPWVQAGAGRYETDFAEIGPRILPPGEPDEAAVAVVPPEDPTDEMIERGQRVAQATGNTLNDAQVHDIWQAMYDDWLASVKPNAREG